MKKVVRLTLNRACLCTLKLIQLFHLGSEMPELAQRILCRCIRRHQLQSCCFYLLLGIGDPPRKQWYVFCSVPTSTNPSYSYVGLNPYDISRPCEGKIEDTLCYPATKYVYLHTYTQTILIPYFRIISTYLDQPSVRAQLGVDPSLSSLNFT